MLALTAAVVAQASAIPVPPDVPVAVPAVEVPPAARQLVCAGPLVQPDDTVAGDAAFDPTPVDVLTRVGVVTVGASDADRAPSATLTPLAGDQPLTVAEPAGGAAGAAEAAAPDGATRMTADPVGDTAARIAGTTASVTSAGDLRGLAAASCQAPAAEQWLVGGSTEIGSSALLVVANPGATPAEVTVEVFGPSGRVDLAGAARFLVAPGAERALLLEGIAAEQRRIVTRVTAAGGLVTAQVQDSRLNGFTPAGTDLVSAGQGPATRQVVGGLVVPDTTIDQPDTAVLRLLAPGDLATRAQVTLLGAAGPVTLPGVESVDLAPGEVIDLPLGGLPTGTYTAVVDSKEPVVAGAMLTRPGLPGQLDDLPTLERAWSAASAVGRSGVVAVPTGITPTLLLSAVGPGLRGAGGDAATGTLHVLGADGAVLDEREVRVEAGTTFAMPATDLVTGRQVAGLALTLEDADRTGRAALAWTVLASVPAADGELVSILDPVPDAAAQTRVPVQRASTLGLP
ncbi:hypothetical protein HIR71_11190 [Cellulomonas fimi]|uniref:Secreted protein n=1 Tax=Cellulomonas fimi TaxID=1708 RepID=A0A7Y0QHY4_CELFI|nr:hypothetical protein [Cellulomonas fimi]